MDEEIGESKIQKFNHIVAVQILEFVVYYR